VLGLRGNELEGIFAMVKFATVIAIVLSLLPMAAMSEEKPVTGPNGLSLICSDFELLSNGGWHSKPNATLRYPSDPGSFGNNTFGPHGINMGGVDVAVFLSENCQKN
jgi:hypothetical protein